jgi:tripartite-type tricarboxylate transporter receptor subunit TctC
MRDFLDKATAVGAMALISFMGAVAQPAWPDRAIKVVVPYTPGGGGNVGLDMVAKSKPDGYTLGMGQTANLAINPALIAQDAF